MQKLRGSVRAPWALAGFLGSYLYVEALGLAAGAQHEAPLVAGLLFVTPCVAFVFGHAVTQHGRSAGRLSALLGFVCTLIGGVANGVLHGVVFGLAEDGPRGLLWGLFGGGLVGAFASVPFLVPLTLTTALAASRGRAREGTLVDRSDRWWTWAALPMCTSLATSIVEATATTSYRAPSLGVRALTVVASVASIALLVTETLRYARARRERGARDDGHAPVFDLGVGSQTWLRAAIGKTAYRDVAVEVPVLRGDPTLATSMLGARVVAHVGLVLLTAGFTALTFWIHAEQSAPTPVAVVTPTPTTIERYFQPTQEDQHPKLLGVSASEPVAYVAMKGRVSRVDWSMQTERTDVAKTTADWLAIARDVGDDNAQAGELARFDARAERWAYIDDARQLHVGTGLSDPGRVVAKGVSEAHLSPSGRALAYKTHDRLELLNDAARPDPATSLPLTDVRAFAVSDESVLVASPTGGCSYGRSGVRHGDCPPADSLVVDGARARVVLCSRSEQSTSCHARSLTHGALDTTDEAHALSFPPGFEPKTLSNEGFLVGTAPGVVGYADVNTARVQIESVSSTYDAAAARWLDGGRALMLRSRPDGWGLVEVDVKRILYP